MIPYLASQDGSVFGEEDSMDVDADENDNGHPGPASDSESAAEMTDAEDATAHRGAKKTLSLKLNMGPRPAKDSRCLRYSILDDKLRSFWP